MRIRQIEASCTIICLVAVQITIIIDPAKYPIRIHNLDGALVRIHWIQVVIYNDVGISFGCLTVYHSTLDGSSEIGLHERSDLCYLICSRHLF